MTAPDRALTLYQPWATLVILGAKTIETRTWSTRHRGPLLIHAGAARDHLFRAGSGPFAAALRLAGCRDLTDLPLGAAVGCVTLDAIRMIGPADLDPDSLDPAERAFGDYRPGRRAWLLSGAVAFVAPVPWPGSRGVWSVDGDLLVAVRDRLGLGMYDAAGPPSPGPRLASGPGAG